MDKSPYVKMSILKTIYIQNNYYNCFSEKTCTKDYPFAYLNGQFCCETNQELVNGGSLNEVASGTCDGIGFSIETTCCKDRKWIKCPHTQCVNRPNKGKSYET